MNLDATVATHLAAVADRDLTTFAATIDDSVTVVLPHGRMLSGRAEVEEFHRDWFADPDWTLKPTVIRSDTLGDTGIVVCDVEYGDLDAQGEPYAKKYLLSLVFHRGADGWRLVHDQNTFC